MDEPPPPPEFRGPGRQPPYNDNGLRLDPVRLRPAEYDDDVSWTLTTAMVDEADIKEPEDKKAEVWLRTPAQ